MAEMSTAASMRLEATASDSEMKVASHEQFQPQGQEMQEVEHQDSQDQDLNFNDEEIPRAPVVEDFMPPDRVELPEDPLSAEQADSPVEDPGFEKIDAEDLSNPPQSSESENPKAKPGHTGRILEGGERETGFFFVGSLRKDAQHKCSFGWVRRFLDCDKIALRSHLAFHSVTVVNETGFDVCVHEWREFGYLVADLGKAGWLHGYPVDCQAKWSDWGMCSASCGGGRQCSQFKILAPARFRGQECTHNDGSDNCADCNAQPCPKDCELGDWEVEPCSALCGGGTQKRTRPVASPSEFGGFCPMPDSVDRVLDVPCNTQACPDEMLEDFRVAVSQTADVQEETHRQSSMLQKTKHHLLHHLPKISCTAGMDSQHTEATASCHEHNTIASKSQGLALFLENGHDECEIAAAEFHQLRDALKHNLPHVVKQMCGGDHEGAQSTIENLLHPLINSTLAQFDRCVEPYRSFAREVEYREAQLYEERSSELQAELDAAYNSYRYEVEKDENAVRRFEQMLKQQDEVFKSQKEAQKEVGATMQQEALEMQDILHDMKANQNVLGLSEGLNMESADEGARNWKSSIVRLRSTVKRLQVYLETLHTHLSRASDKACEDAKHHVAGMVSAYRTGTSLSTGNSKSERTSEEQVKG
ncbi:unnamed protein product [Durusdinium trenchii]|uniref:Uncharacterized protein n=1 Tax=Durusdinium trenchii TaxID=1381693 RepID=A0ABP0P3A5_9DINO